MKYYLQLVNKDIYMSHSKGIEDIKGYLNKDDVENKLSEL